MYCTLKLTVSPFVLATLAVTTVVHAETEVEKKPVVQIAILLDNSGSMSGLINQARGELWKVVNEFVTAKIDGVRPDLQVAVYHYGSPPATQLVPLTDDLDKVSEALFGIPVSGGSEYCGQAIDMATKELQWSESHDDLKLLFIAGNEPFTQGPVDYREACKAAIENGILVNTIHCGNGIPNGWRDGAVLADGKAMNIDHTQSVVHIEAPQDKEIARLGVELNKTYIVYGAKGVEGGQRQIAQDANASNTSIAAAQQRAVAKANAFYRNDAWDLCDACKAGKVDLAKIKAEDLPKNMRIMTLKERKAYVEKMQQQRVTLQKRINDVNAERVKFVAAKSKELAEQSGQDTLDQALIGAIRVQATAKNYSFE
ncbi:MAG TPA: vWA domain-containing protein [Pirellulaceae bacterium]|nr:vWA domain-containing protein [Pirellulaceae bacterium]